MGEGDDGGRWAVAPADVPEPADPSGPRPADICPYQGLAPFEAEKADLFFGRASATANLLERLAPRLAERGSVLLVSGASGVGKSSLLRAGLMPALARGKLPVTGSRHWPRLLLSPTSAPLRALAEKWAESFGGSAETVERRLRDDPRELAGTLASGRFVLVVDQFEELFTLVGDERERQAFVRALHALAGRPGGAGVVVGVRADYWDRCAAYPQFAEAIQDGQVIVEPMTEPDLRLAITGPADAAGLEIEAALVETILADLRADRPAGGDRYEAGALPLLSHALRNTWERREDGRLTVRGYEESGRVQDSVRRTADEILERLPAGDRKTVLKLLRRMTVITAGGRMARRRITLAEAHAAASARTAQDRDRVEALLSSFADRRLLTLHEDAVEIAHDALLTAWPALRQWLEPDLTAQSVYDQLVEDAAEWDEHHRDAAFLYRGARLLAVDDVRPRWDRDPDSFPPPGPTATGFLAASARAARQAGRRRRLVQAGLATLSAVALVAAGLAVHAAGDADRQRHVAVSRQLAAQSEATGDGPLASMLAVAAWRIAPTDEARNRLLAAATRHGRGTLAGHAGGVTALAFSPGGPVLATGGHDGAVRLWDAASRRQLGAPIAQPDGDCSGASSVKGMAFAPDGRTLATACLSTVRFWDVATRREVGPPLELDSVVSALAYNPDGKTLATGEFSGLVRQWDAVAHRPHGPPMGRADDGPERSTMIHSLVYGRDGRTLVTGSEDETAQLWDTVAARRLGAPFEGHTAPVIDVAVSPDGATLATVSWDRTARLWDIATREQKGVLKDRRAGFDSIAFSPDGTRIATGGSSGRTVLWDTAGRRQVLALADNVGSVDHVAFSPDGKLLAAAGADGVVRLADPRTHLQIGTPMPAQATVALSPDGRTLAAGAAGAKNPAIRLWDVATQRPSGPPLVPPGAHRPVAMTAFLPDGRTLLTSGADGLRLWDVAAGRVIAHDGTLGGVAELSADGRFVAVHDDRAIAFWDVARRRESGPRIRVPGHTDIVTAMAFSPDGATLATAGFDDQVRLFDVASRRQTGVLPFKAAGGFVNDLAFSPDGRTLALTAADSTVRLWDVARRRPVGLALVIGTDAISALAFSPDGRVIATGSTDDEVRLWDLRAHRRLGEPMAGHTRGVTAIAFGRAGTVVATVAGDGTARLWDARTPADPVAAACANAGRPLTRDEWENYVPQEDYRRTCP
ncbi:nSTAND1 domain-containing NTPase [Actinomadura monticuli]|uniref:Novel STAND NTPase 1 domain-containing protein n=1 Tax=Actinomadura monticuli TaxID=3097367 RepID=A0ABV4Q765_9ACTN